MVRCFNLEDFQRRMVQLSQELQELTDRCNRDDKVPTAAQQGSTILDGHESPPSEPVGDTASQEQDKPFQASSSYKLDVESQLKDAQSRSESLATDYQRRFVARSDGSPTQSASRLIVTGPPSVIVDRHWFHQEHQEKRYIAIDGREPRECNACIGWMQGFGIQ